MKKVIISIAIMIGVFYMSGKVIYVSNDTIIDMNKAMTDAIEKYHKKYKVPESLVKAIIHTESRGAEPFTAPRYEKDLLKRKWAMRVVEEHNLDTNNRFIKYSYGPLQVLYLNAVHNGFKGSPFELANPETNVKYGCLYLGKLRKRFRNSKTMFTDIISAYNQGGNMFYDENGNNVFDYDKGEKYRNQRYVNETISEYRKLLKKQGIVSQYDKLFQKLLA